MSTLECNIGVCQSKQSSISVHIEQYNKIKNEIDSASQSVIGAWKSSSADAYYSKYLEKKNNFDKLSNIYEQLNDFLSTTFNDYQKVESSNS